MTDFDQRDRALDVSNSYIVQAPAGSGKTELLIQRMLALLAEVDHPQQILAITFTNKAAAEMRSRVIDALTSAALEEPVEEAHKLKTRTLASAVIARHGESLLQSPGQLTIQTIDSFNTSLVRKMPWLSRFGGVPDIVEDGELLYREAIEIVLSQLMTDGQCCQALMALLSHQDNRVDELQRLLIAMLQQRDQWLEVLWAHRGVPQELLNQSVESYCEAELRGLESAWPVHLNDALLRCARFAAEHRHGDFPIIDNRPGAQKDDTDKWLYLADLLLTSTGQLRKTVTVKNGFPSGSENKADKQAMLTLLDELSSCDEFIRHLRKVRDLPFRGYSESQWQVLHHLLNLLPHLVAELWLVFRAHGQVDFSEIALKAIDALGRVDRPSDLLLKIDQDLRHILVDEFQDTSRLQYRLLNLLTGGWSKGDGRTLFLVGDPMQSIYRFREAEVGLFLHCFKGHFGEHRLPLQALRLTANFRSQKGIVDWLNRTFGMVFPQRSDELTGAVPMSAAEAVKPMLSGDGCQFYPFLDRNDEEEARCVVDIIRREREVNRSQKIAILVRNRNHLTEILPQLKENGMRYQSQDIDLLGASPAVLDVIHLAKAILHRGDRLSWLAVLRAPWCGMTLSDLYTLFKKPTVSGLGLLIDERVLPQLSQDGQNRLKRVLPVLKNALDRRGRVSLRTLVEDCWFSLGGAECTERRALPDVQRVFGLLEKLDFGGDLLSFDQLERGLSQLFAGADSEADGTLQVMTIHKAKGLEFDCVIVPGLGRKTRGQDSPLLRWFDHPQHGLLMAVASGKGDHDRDPLYRVLTRLDAEQGAQEDSRLLYVAATRAAKRLHLLGHARLTSEGLRKAEKGSLLEKLWPIYADRFDDLKPQTVSTNEEIRGPRLKRLPAAWSPWQLGSITTKVKKRDDLPQEMSFEDQDNAIFSGWENPLHRLVGTEVHRQFERLAKRGIVSWEQEDRDSRRQRLMRSLLAAGISDDDLRSSTEKVIQAIELCLSSSRGRWILFPHQNHQSEMPVSGLIDGVLVHAVIDRFFVAEGVCWVIDYKTSQPAPNEPLDKFYSRQMEQYKNQLDKYAQLITLVKIDMPVRTALYFPLFDGWCEIER